MRKFSLLLFAILLGLTIAGIGFVQAQRGLETNIADIPVKELKQMLQVNETSAGIMVWAKGAVITEISSLEGGTTPNLLKVKIFNQEGKVHITENTNVVRHYWGKSPIDLSEFSVGDIVNIYGTLDSQDTTLVHAKTVRNVSIQKRHAVFQGEIKSITPPDTFTMETAKRGFLTIVTKPDTKIYLGKELKTFSDLQIGTKVLVRGVWDKTLSKVQALVIRIKPTETATSTPAQ